MEGPEAFRKYMEACTDDWLMEYMKLYPELFTDGYPYVGMDVEVGWKGILDELFSNLSAEAKLHPEDYKFFSVDQIKEKWGTLRFYFHGGNDKTDLLVSEAEHRSEHVCEDCGEPGELRDDLPWIRTLCDRCMGETMDRMLERYGKFHPKMVVDILSPDTSTGHTS